MIFTQVKIYLIKISVSTGFFEADSYSEICE